MLIVLRFTCCFGWFDCLCLFGGFGLVSWLLQFVLVCSLGLVLFDLLLCWFDCCVGLHMLRLIIVVSCLVLYC